MKEAAPLGYFRGRWPEEVVPGGEPIWFLYEVNIEKDCVLRAVEIYDNGAIGRCSLDIEARHGLAMDSLVEGPFLPTVLGVPLDAISPEEFERAWQASHDHAVWSQHNPIPPRS